MLNRKFCFTTLVSCFLILISILSCVNVPLNKPKNKKVIRSLNLLNPPSPFVIKNKSNKSLKSKAKIIGREIVFGNKKLIVNSDGSLILVADDKSIFKSYFHVNTEHSIYLTNNNITKIPCKWNKSHVGINKSKYINETFIINGNFPLNNSKDRPREGKFTEKVTLLEDNKIKFDLLYIIPKNSKSKLNNTCIFIESNNTERLNINQINYKFNKKIQRFFNPQEITFSKNNPRRSFSIKVLSSAMVTIANKNAKEDFRIYPQNSNHITYILDLGKGLKGIKTKKIDIYAGVDFKRTDDLELPKYNISRNLIQNPSFEQGVMYCLTKNHFDTFLGIKAINTETNNALFGKHSLKANLYKKWYDLTFSTVPAYPGKYVFSFYVKGVANIKNQSLSIQNASVVSLVKKNWSVSKKWTRISATFQIKKRTAISCSLRLSGEKDEFIYLDGVQLERGDKVSEFTSPFIQGMLLTSKEDNFFNINENIDAKLRIFSSKPNISSELKVTVKDFFSTQVFAKKYKFSTNNDGIAYIKLPFNDKFGEGIYVVKVAYTLPNGKKFYDFFRFSIMSFLKNNHKLKRMFSNFYHGTMKRDLYPGLETYLKRCRDIGIGSETHSGFITKGFDTLLKKYGISTNNNATAGPLMKNYKKVENSKGMKFFGIYNNKGWANGAKLFIKDFRLENNGVLTEDYLKRFKLAVSDLIKSYPWLRCWALTCEASAKWPELLKDDMDSFIKLQIAFYNTLKAIDPTLKVYNGSPCNIYKEGGVKEIKDILKEINGKIKYDSFAIHSYLPEGPYLLETNIEAFLDMLKEFGYPNVKTFYPEGMHYGPYNVPIWGTVSASWSPPKTWYYGTLSYDMGWTEKLSAAWIARSWLIHLKFMDRTIVATSSIGINNFNIDAKLTPRAYQKVPNTLGNLLGNSIFIEDVSFAPDTKCLIFEDNKQRPVVAIWSKIRKVDSGLETAPMAIANFQNERVEIFDLMGNHRKFKRSEKGNIRFPVSTFPFFIRGTSKTTKLFSNIFRNAKIIGGNLIPLKMVAKISNENTITLTLSNQIARNVKGCIKVSELKKNINIATHEKISLKVKLPYRLLDDRITKMKIPVMVKEKGSLNSLNKNLNFEGFICKKISSVIKIDGNDNDWENIPQIQIKNRTLSTSTGEKIGYPGDFNAFFKVAWDKDYLYLMVKVEDDKFTHQFYKKTEQRWDNDSLQIFIDTKCDARDREYHGYDSNDYDYAVFPDKNGKATTFRYKSPNQQLTLGTEAPQDRTIAKYIKSSFQKTSNGYIYEIAFPTKYILPIKLKNNYAIGFSLFVNDRDKGKHTKQSLTLTPPGTGGYRSPHLYPVMLLKK